MRFNEEMVRGKTTAFIPDPLPPKFKRGFESPGCVPFHPAACMGSLCTISCRGR
jgi:hypothetical protein